MAWYWKNSGEQTLSGVFYEGKAEENKCELHPVKMKKPNELGLYDMSGNVNEICQGKMCKGGSYMSLTKECRVDSSGTWRASGFRLVMESK